MKHPIEIRSPDIDTDAIMARIRENLATRSFVEIDAAAFPAGDVVTARAVDDPVLDYHLEQARILHNDVWPELTLAPSWATQLPVVGKVWQKIREQAHRLVLYYVEMVVSKQVGFNEHVVGSLSRLTAMQEKVATLEAEVSALRKQLTDIKQGLAQRD